MISSRALLTGIWTLAVLATAGCSSSTTPKPAGQQSAGDSLAAADLEQLVELMGQRLLIMHDVARWKWEHRLPITDPAREAVLLEHVRQRAHDLELEEGLAVSFISAQVAAGKQVQQQDFERWQTEPSAQDQTLPDLTTVIRPQIDQLNERLLETLARVAPHLDEESIQQQLSIARAKLNSESGFNSAILATAQEPLIRHGAGDPGGTD